MVVVDINTREVIERRDDIPAPRVFWTTPEHWKEYNEACQEADVLWTRKLLYGES